MPCVTCSEIAKITTKKVLVPVPVYLHLFSVKQGWDATGIAWCCFPIMCADEDLHPH